jgi:hypothetical protein
LRPFTGSKLWEAKHWNHCQKSIYVEPFTGGRSRRSAIGGYLWEASYERLATGG